jgi:hypothetical protein
VWYLMNLDPGCVLSHPAGDWTTLPDVFAAQLLPPEPEVLAGCENNLRLRQKDSAKYIRYSYDLFKDLKAERFYLN